MPAGPRSQRPRNRFYLNFFDKFIRLAAGGKLDHPTGYAFPTSCGLSKPIVRTSLMVRFSTCIVASLEGAFAEQLTSRGGCCFGGSCFASLAIATAAHRSRLPSGFRVDPARPTMWGGVCFRLNPPRPICSSVSLGDHLIAHTCDACTKATCQHIHRHPICPVCLQEWWTPSRGGLGRLMMLGEQL